jgi:hypothetical protein
MLLPKLLKSVLPHRVLFPRRRRFRDLKDRMELPIMRLLSFAVCGVLLGYFVVTTTSVFRDPPARILQAATMVPATDGRAVPDIDHAPVADQPAYSVAAIIRADIRMDISKACADLAREKLMAGLTNYYLQRRARPGASSEEVADTSPMTGLLAGPGDPATATPHTSCEG